MTYSNASGSCPLPGPTLVQLGDEQVASHPTPTTTCVARSTVWSENDCKNEIVFHCDIKDGAGVDTNDATAITRQATQDGSRIEGTVSERIELATGQICNVTASVTYVRQ